MSYEDDTRSRMNAAVGKVLAHNKPREGSRIHATADHGAVQHLGTGDIHLNRASMSGQARFCAWMIGSIAGVTAASFLMAYILGLDFNNPAQMKAVAAIGLLGGIILGGVVGATKPD